MLGKIKQFLAPITFYDEEKTHVSGLLNILLLATIPVLVLFFIVFVSINPSTAQRWPIIGFLFILAVGAYGLMRRGRIQLASVLFTTGIWAALTFTAITSGGVRSPGYICLFIVVLLAGLLLGLRVGIVFAVLCFFTGMGLIYAEVNDLLPPPRIEHTLISFWLPQGFSFMMAAMTVYLATSSIKQGLNRAQKEIGERVLAEGKLRKAYQNIENLFNAIGQQALILDPEYRIISGNNAFLEKFGVPEEEVRGKKCYEIYHETNEPPEDCPCYKMKLTNQMETAEMEVEAFNEIYLVSCTPVHDEADQLIQIIHLAIDITELKQTREELWRLKDINDSIIQNMLEAIIVMDPEGIITFINPATSNLLGYLPKEIIGRHWKDVVPPDQHEIVDEIDVRRDKGDTDPYEIIITHKNGTRVPLLTSSSSRYMEGQFLGYIAVFTDISEIKQAEEVLKLSEKRYSTLFNETRDGIVLIDPKKGQIEDCNPCFEDITGRNIDELKKMKIWEIQPSEKVELAKKKFLEIIEKGSGGAGDLDIQHPDGRIVPIEFTSVVIDLLGKPMVLSSARDITERKQTEELQNAVYRIAEAAVLSPHLEELFPVIHEIISDVMSTENFYIALYDQSKNLLSFPYFVDEVDFPTPPHKPGKSLTEYVIRTGDSLLCDEDCHQELIKRGEVDLVGEPSPIWLGVPLVIGKNTIGVMAVQHYTNPKAYGEKEKRMLEYVSFQVAKSIELKITEEKLQKQTFDLGKRMKELNCLYNISRLIETPNISLEKMLQGTVNLIPPAWQFPEITCARLEWGSRVFRSSNFQESEWKQTSDITVNDKRLGVLEVYYLAERQESTEELFLNEEQQLIDAITGNLAKTIERKWAEDALLEALRLNEKIVSGSPIGISIYDSTGKCIAANDSIAELIGAQREEVLKQNYHQIESWKKSGMYEKVISAISENTKKRHSLVVTSTFGKDVFLDCHIVPFLSKNQMHLLVMINDISERIQAEEALKERDQRLRALTQKAIVAQEEERKRVSRELHDEAGQALTVLKIELSRYGNKLSETGIDAEEDLMSLIQSIDQTHDQLRSIAQGLRPPAIDTLGLTTAMESYCENFAINTNIKIKYKGEDVTDLGDHIKISLYRILQEALRNIIRHAEAIEVEVALQKIDTNIQLVIMDDGKGFATTTFSDSPSGLGIIGMQERMELLNGSLEISSSDKDGTKITAICPTGVL